MALQITNLKRKFILMKDKKEVILKDVNKEFTPEETMQFYASQYPELVTCTIDGPKIEDDFAVYSFKTTIGTKG